MKPIKQGGIAFKVYEKYKQGNPHKVGTQAYREWEFGFNQAYFSNLDKVQKLEARGRGEAI